MTNAKRRVDQMLHSFVFKTAEIEAAASNACRSAAEGCDRLHGEGRGAFICAAANGRKHLRFIEPMGRVLMIARLQPFASGTISETIHMPAAAAEEAGEIRMHAWMGGLRSMAIHRDRCKPSSEALKELGVRKRSSSSRSPHMTSPSPSRLTTWRTASRRRVADMRKADIATTPSTSWIKTFDGETVDKALYATPRKAAPS